jgi:maltooligosyltrehalose trehalohydrolase
VTRPAGGEGASNLAPRSKLGPRLVEGGAAIGVWAPSVRSLAVRVDGRTLALEPDERGIWRGVVEGAGAGDDYLLVLDGQRERPDPRSRFQPYGPHGPSRLVDLGPPPPPFAPPALRELVFYELHCGTFTPEGTFDAAIGRLDHLARLGLTAVEVMPVAAFPGERGWGYDGVDLYAVHAAYGGPAGFRRFVDACHAAGLAVLLDVVYNHLGPEGDYLGELGPYLTDRYATPWGRAVNLDGPGSDFVRAHVLDNAEMWVAEFGVDGLRLDAVHALHDASPVHILQELAARVHAARPGALVVAENELHQPILVTGYGVDAMWADDLHHAVHVALTGEATGYLKAFEGLDRLATALHAGWVHDRDPAGLGGERFVACSQNHDQVGNRGFGERLAVLVGPELDAVVSVLVACAPYLPLLFQGQEWGETRPFLYFTDHGPELAEAVRRGRRKEFAAFDWGPEVPDPNDPATFERSKLDWSRAGGPVLELWRDLLRLRREVPALGNCRRDLTTSRADVPRRLVTLERTDPSGSRALVVANLGDRPQSLPNPDTLRLRLATRPHLSSRDIPGASAMIWTN